LPQPRAGRLRGASMRHDSSYESTASATKASLSAPASSDTGARVAPAATASSPKSKVAGGGSAADDRGEIPVKTRGGTNSLCHRLSVCLCQQAVRRGYQNPYVQWFIAVLILGNFFTNIIEKQIDPLNENYPEVWVLVEFAWNLVFILELVWNIWGHWYSSLRIKGHFLCSGWNIFDTIVVAVSLPSMTGAELPPAATNLRIVRAFRVFRLFKRIKSLRKILASLAKAVPGMFNATVVTGLVMCIFAILAVDLFGKFGEDRCEQTEYSNLGEFDCWLRDNTTIKLRTARGLTYGDEYYGTFFRSLFTLFQVLTGESWSEAVARPLIMSDGSISYIATIYHVCFILFCGIVLVNVVVAVLLEKMMEGSSDEGEMEDPNAQGAGHTETQRLVEMHDVETEIVELKANVKQMRIHMKSMLQLLNLSASDIQVNDAVSPVSFVDGS